MPALPKTLLRHRVTVEAYGGSNATGPFYGAPRIIRCFVDEGSRQIDASTTAAGRFITTLDNADKVPVQSRVALPGGAVRTVVEVNRRDGGGLPVPSHLEVLFS